MRTILMHLRLVALTAVMCTVASMAQPYVKADHLSYSVVYDYKTMNPAVVTYDLIDSDFKGSISSRPRYFKADVLLPPPHRKSTDFTYSGYERGHLCPSGHRDSRKDWFKDTFVTSNVLLMWPQTNAGAWKDIELLERKHAVSGHRLKCAAGPVLMDCDTIMNGTKTLLVPRYLFKILKCSKCPDGLQVYVIPNCAKYNSYRKCTVQLPDIAAMIDPTIFNYIVSWINQ